MSVIAQLLNAFSSRQKATLRILKSGRNLRSFSFAFRLSSIEAATGATILVSKSHFIVSRLDLTFSFGIFHWAKDHISTLLELQSRLGCRYTFGSDTLKLEFIFEGQDYRFTLISGHELGIILEVFCEHLYHPLNRFPVIDIGANFGAVSIFLAKAQKVSVIAFEPVPETFERLNTHIIENKLEHLIRAVNAGVASESGTASIIYNRVFPGSASIEGIYGDQKVVADVAIEGEKLEIKLTSAVDLMDSLDQPAYFLKLDCEGAEHQILDAIYQTPNFAKIKMISAEVHSIASGSNDLFETRLRNCGFMLYRHSTPTDDVTHITGARS